MSSHSTTGADDPFFPREGKTLTWSKVNMSVSGTKKKPGKDLLQDVWGECPKKEITAIMGPSGAGKTSLLNIIAGRSRTGGALTVTADVRLNNSPVDPTNLDIRKQIAFVAQDDSLMATATPRESIRFSAKLRLSRATTEEELDTLTDTMIDSLGLSHCADTYVGSALMKGISGGERKRTSVGVELVTKPAIIFLDEPTSGLDSYSATQVIDLLHKVAEAGTSVLFTIHQPSSEIFNAFDHLILLNKGRVMYQGAVGSIPTFFENCKHPVPPNYNPADWIMTIAQQIPEEQLNQDGFFQSDNRNLGASLSGGFSKKSEIITHGAAVQSSMLFKREIQNIVRDKASLGARFGITIFLNLLFGIIFLDVGRLDNEDFSRTRSHFGALVMVMISAMFGAAQPALFAIPVERPVFLREYSTNHYGVLPYFMNRLAIEATMTFLQTLVAMLIVHWLIGFQANFFLLAFVAYALSMASTAVAVLLGCAIDDTKMAQEFLPLLFVPQMLFAGFFVAIDLLPNWLQWVQYVCSLTYGVRLGMLAEFDSCVNVEDALENSTSVRNCQMILEDINSDYDSAWWYWLLLGALFIVLRLWALWVLKSKAQSFY
jgi:ABC-type multidrug transport system ATPase subunit